MDHKRSYPSTFGTLFQSTGRVSALTELTTLYKAEQSYEYSLDSVVVRVFGPTQKNVCPSCQSSVILSTKTVCDVNCSDNSTINRQ